MIATFDDVIEKPKLKSVLGILYTNNKPPYMDDVYIAEDVEAWAGELAKELEDAIADIGMRHEIDLEEDTCVLKARAVVTKLMQKAGGRA